MPEANACPYSECLFDENAALLERTAALLEDLEPDAYATVDARCLGGSIGGHTRHCVEFYQCFLAGLESGRIDYDARARDVRIENEVAHAVAALRHIAEEIRDASARQDTMHLLRVIENHTGSDTDWSATSVGRELRFLLSHTVHHCALIAILLRLR
jgi:uncharacterized damage-inducible protein DinB